MNTLWVQEVDALSGLEPMCWRMLTSEPIQTADQVASEARYYALRWRIEAYHKALKSGDGVERQRMQHSENLKRMIMVTAFEAVRLLHLREALQPRADDHPDRCNAVLEQDEWRVLWKVYEQTGLPEQPPTLAWAYRAIARLGGFTDTKKPAGPAGILYGVVGHVCRTLVEGHRLLA